MPKVILDPKKFLQPGKPGFNDGRVPWAGIRNAMGWKKPDSVQMEIHGFFLMDRRRDPPVAIFKNCEVPKGEGFRPVLLVAPEPFQYLGEALHHRDRMHLSADDEKRVVPSALCPDDGPGYEHPQYMAMDEKQARER